MKHTVEDHTQLPEAPYYVRSMSDNTIMIHGKTGDSYVRADGEPWDADGYAFERDGTIRRATNR